MSSLQFFLADLYAGRLAGTHQSPALLSEAPPAPPADVVPSEDGQDDAAMAAAAAR